MTQAEALYAHPRLTQGAAMSTTDDSSSTSGVPGTDAVTAFASVTDLANAMRRASAAHGEHEKRIGAADPDWPDWYAAYMVAEQAGTELPL
jgi:hypothetical protein